MPPCFFKFCKLTAGMLRSAFFFLPSNNYLTREDKKRILFGNKLHEVNYDIIFLI